MQCQGRSCTALQCGGEWRGRGLGALASIFLCNGVETLSAAGNKCMAMRGEGTLELHRHWLRCRIKVLSLVDAIWNLLRCTGQSN